MQTRITSRLLAPALLAVTLSGCSSVYVPGFIQVYQPDIQQGNIIEQAQLDRLEAGMPQSQVRALLGTPSLDDIFHAGRRDTYVYYDKRGKKEAFRHVLVVEYDRDGRVTSIERDGMDLAAAPSMNSAELPAEDEAPPSPAAAPAEPAEDDYSPLPAGGDTGLGTPQPGL
jgi:outer membrane protein assembly factor BamE